MVSRLFLNIFIIILSFDGEISHDSYEQDQLTFIFSIIFHPLNLAPTETYSFARPHQILDQDQV